MKAGRIISKPSGKGPEYFIEFDEGKTIRLDTRYLLPGVKIEDVINQDVEFDNAGGILQKINLTQNHKEIFKYVKQAPVSTSQRNAMYQGSYKRNDTFARKVEFAHSPYNFIPINDKVVASPLKADEVRFDEYGSNRLTGDITYNIESLSPLFIRGLKSISKDSIAKSPEFFKGKKYCIPGSSLRGLLRTMIEIASYSKMGSINNRTKDTRFHYRAFADKSLDLREAYSRNMIGIQENSECYFPKVKAGVIIKKGKEFIIHPGKYFRVEEDDAKNAGVISDLMSHFNSERNKFSKNNRYEQSILPVFFKADPESVHYHSKKLKYAKVTRISTKNEDSLKEGFLCCTGWMVGPGVGPKSRGKHMHWVIGDINESIDLNVPTSVIENYAEDDARDGIDLLEELKRRNKVPCFYISDQKGKVTSFGHTGMFRLAYDKSLIEFFPSAHRELEKADFTEMLFGKNDLVPGRVFVEDGYLQEGIISEKVMVPAIMGSPKPTTFQHYLQQDSGSIHAEGDNFRGIKDYNQDARISGHKMYWHQEKVIYPDKITVNTANFRKFLDNENSYPEFKNLLSQNARTDILIASLSTIQNDLLVKYLLTSEKSQHTALRPVLRNANFQGRIRFENLTDEELGALLFVINLPENLCLKIGMGKGLGLGTIQMKPITVSLSNREYRYSDLLAEWPGQNNSAAIGLKNEIQEKVKIFERFILDAIKSDKNSLWEEPRMMELKIMLDYKNHVSGEKSKYMLIDKPGTDENGRPKKINEYKNRPVLQPPSEYIKKQ